jgi:hypothetical protein
LNCNFMRRNNSMRELLQLLPQNRDTTNHTPLRSHCASTWATT